MPNQKHYIPAIDSLRAIAAIMVVMGHSGAFLCFRGWKEKSISAAGNLGYGVDLFFVISGFVVFSSILPHMHVLRHNFKEFWFRFLTRRFFRLAPICFFWICIVLILARRLPSKYFIDYHGIIKEATGIIFYLYNYMCAFKFYLLPDYPMHLGYHHSLNTEEQFYFFLPILLLFLKEKPFFFFSIIFVFCGYVFQRPTVWYYFRYDSFFYGIIFAQVFHYFNLHRADLRGLAGFVFKKIAGPVLLWYFVYLLIFTYYHQIHHRTFETAALISAGILVLVCLGVRPLIIEKFDALLVYIGNRSYSLYLAHMPTFLILNALVVKLHWAKDIDSPINVIMTPTQNICIALIALSILWLFVELSYHYIETPCRELGKKLSSREKYANNETPLLNTIGKI
jgi:peptidoglycan/LPS O-acetylase OafA/YrhL